jgi:hypothetical protein
VVSHPRLCLFPELRLYLAFAGYMVLTLLWTGDVELASAILIAILNFIFILVLTRSCCVSQPSRSTLGPSCWTSGGCGALALITHFPFIYPAGLSSNTVAGMYLFALIVTVTIASCTTPWVPHAGCSPSIPRRSPRSPKPSKPTVLVSFEIR